MAMFTKVYVLALIAGALSIEASSRSSQITANYSTSSISISNAVKTLEVSTSTVFRLGNATADTTKSYSTSLTLTSKNKTAYPELSALHTSTPSLAFASISSYIRNKTSLHSISSWKQIQASSTFMWNSSITSVISHNESSSLYTTNWSSISKYSKETSQKIATYYTTAGLPFSRNTPKTRPVSSVFASSTITGTFPSSGIFNTSTAMSKSSLTLLSSNRYNFATAIRSSSIETTLQSASKPPNNRTRTSTSPLNSTTSTSTFKTSTSKTSLYNTMTFATSHRASSREISSSNTASYNVPSYNSVDAKTPKSPFVYSSKTEHSSKFSASRRTPSIEISSSYTTKFVTPSSSFAASESASTPNPTPNNTTHISVSSTHVHHSAANSNLTLSTSASLLTPSTTSLRITSGNKLSVQSTKSSSVLIPTRSSAIDIPKNKGGGKGSSLSERDITIISTCSAGGVVIFIIIICCVMLSRKKTQRKKEKSKQKKDQEMRPIPEEGKIDWNLKWSTMRNESVFNKNSDTFGGFLYGDTNNAFLSEVDEEQQNDSNVILDLSGTSGDIEKAKNANENEIPRCRTFSDSGMLRDKSDQSLIDVIKKTKESKNNASVPNDDHVDQELPTDHANEVKTTFSSFQNKGSKPTPNGKKNSLILLTEPLLTDNINANNAQENKENSWDGGLGIDNEVFCASDENLNDCTDQTKLPGINLGEYEASEVNC